LFISPIKTLPGPPWTDTGEPGALANNDCCEALEGLLPEKQERNEIEDAASNRISRPILAGTFTIEVIASLLSVSVFKTLRHRRFFHKKIIDFVAV
jgi:hypothetical protein